MTYSIIVLDTRFGEAVALNNNTEIVGKVFEGDTSHAMLWRPYGSEKSLDLGDLGGGDAEAFDINDFTEVTGSSNLANVTYEYNAFLWKASTGMVSLGGRLSSGYAINYKGAVVGQSHDASGKQYAFLWDDVDGFRLVPGAAAGSKAYGINNTGTVVGASNTELLYSYAGQARRWTADGKSLLIKNTLGGDNAHATAINIYGVVVGRAEAQDGYHAFRWTSSSGMQALGDYGIADNNDLCSEAKAINTAGDIVGKATGSDGGHGAVLWRNGTMYDLNANLPADWSWVVGAYDINDKGCIAAAGHNQDGHDVPILMVPVVVKQLSLSSSQTTGGGSMMAKVTLSDDAPFPFEVRLSLDGLSGAARLLQSTLTIPEGAREADFQVTTFATPRTVSGRVTATFGDRSVEASLTVEPA